MVSPIPGEIVEVDARNKGTSVGTRTFIDILCMEQVKTHTQKYHTQRGRALTLLRACANKSTCEGCYKHLLECNRECVTKKDALPAHSKRIKSYNIFKESVLVHLVRILYIHKWIKFISRTMPFV